MNQARRMGFEVRWFTALRVLGVLEDSPMRDLDQIPFPSPAAAMQDPSMPIEEEETVSMRELVEQIDAHVKSDETEATSISSRDGNGAGRGRRMGSSPLPHMDFSCPIPAPPRMMGKIYCPIPTP